MKLPRSIFVALLALAPAHAELPPGGVPGFLEIPFGAPPETVKKQLPSRTRARFNPQKSTDAKLVFDGGKFANFKVKTFEIAFVNGSFWEGVAVLEEVSKGREKEYQTFKQLLTEKYGAPTDEERTGNGSIAANWWVPTGVTKNHVFIWTDLAGKGMKVGYCSDAIKNQPAVAPVPEKERKVKPLRVSPSAKEDL